MRNTGTLQRCRLVSRGWILVSVVALSAVTAACNFLTTEDDPRRPPDVFDKVRGIDLLPRFPQQIATQQTGRGDGAQPATFLGSGNPTNGGSNLANVVGAQPAPNGEGFELNFENTPITGVVKVVLGDILGLGYLIDPRVQGTVTLASGQSVSGTVKQMDDFNLSMIDGAGNYRSWPRESIKVELDDRLAAHRQLLEKYTDADMHNLTAYLVTLK